MTKRTIYRYGYDLDGQCVDTYYALNGCSALMIMEGKLVFEDCIDEEDREAIRKSDPHGYEDQYEKPFKAITKKEFEDQYRKVMKNLHNTIKLPKRF